MFELDLYLHVSSVKKESRMRGELKGKKQVRLDKMSVFLNFGTLVENKKFF